MKRIVFSAALIMSQLVSMGQKIDFESVKFEYLKLPLLPIQVTPRTFSTSIILSYEEDVKAQKLAYDNYVIEETAKAQKEKSDYDNKKTSTLLTEKLIGGANATKPTGIPVLKPKEYYAKSYDKALVDNAVVIPGFTKGGEGEAKVTILVDGFVTGALVEKTIDPNAPQPGVLISSTSTTPKPKTFCYELEVKNMITLKIENKAGVVLQQIIIPGTAEFSKVKTKEFATKAELYNYALVNRISFYQSQDELLFNNNMKLLSEYLSNNFGYVPTTRNTSVIVIRDKDVNYDEYTQAYEKAMKGYNWLTNEDEKQGAIDEINGAIELWKKAISESDIENKKARINAKVTEATYLNCAEAYIWLNNYSEAENCLIKLKSLNLDKYSNKANELTKFISEQKKRFKANKI